MFRLFKLSSRSFAYKGYRKFSSTVAFNPYYVLGVDKTASYDEIKKQYFKLASELHPDKNKALDATKQFILVKEAFELIKKMHGKAVHIDFEGEKRPRRDADFKSARPNASDYNEEFWKEDRQRSEHEYKEYAYKAKEDADTEHMADSFETIHSLRDIKFRPDDVAVPDPTKRFNMGALKGEIRSFQKDGHAYQIMIIMGMAILLYNLNSIQNEINEEMTDNIIDNLSNMTEFEQNLVETKEERTEAVIKNLKRDKQYTAYIEQAEAERTFEEWKRSNMAPSMRPFIRTSDLE
jgi:curved DNA-binding protein CbpA